MSNGRHGIRTYDLHGANELENLLEAPVFPGVFVNLSSKLGVAISKQLFIDRRLIAGSERLKLAVNPPVKRPAALLKSDKPWDAFRLIYFSIAKDGDVYKMWYQAFDDDQWGSGISRMCYAVVLTAHVKNSR